MARNTDPDGPVANPELDYVPIKPEVESVLIKIERVVVDAEMGTTRAVIDYLPWSGEKLEEPVSDPVEDLESSAGQPPLEEIQFSLGARQRTTVIARPPPRFNSNLKKRAYKCLIPILLPLLRGYGNPHSRTPPRHKAPWK